MNNREDILEKLKDSGHRITKARAAVIESLSRAKTPLTASTIFSSLNGLGLVCNRATVYRELVFLLEKDIVRQVRFPGKATHYEINSWHHHHLVCIKCNAVKAVVLGKHLENQERQIYRTEKFKVISHSLEFYGLCRDCDRKHAG